MGGNTSTILGVVGAAVGGYFGGPAGAAIGMSVGSAIGSAIDPPVVPGPKLGDARIQTSRDNIPIPVSWARSHVIGNITQLNPIREVTKEVGGKGGGPTTTETRRYRTFAIGIGRSYYGPIGGLDRIWENDKLVADYRPNPEIPLQETLAFEEGFTLYYGVEDQMPDPELESHTGLGYCPAYRGLAYIVFNDKDITDFGSAIPTYRFEIVSSYPIEATSHIYPIEALDELQAACAFTEGKISAIPEDSYEQDRGFVSGSVDVLLLDTEADPDEYDQDRGFISGEVRVLLLDTDADPDEYDQAREFISGEVEVKLVEHDIEPDELQSGSAFTSGTITPV